MPNPLNLNHNIASMNTRRHLNQNSITHNTQIQRLSSGLRINSAADDASGLYVSEGFRSQISGMAMGVRNAEQGNNLLQVAEGTLNEVSAMLLRMRELAMQSANSTMNDQNREAIEAEVSQLKQEIDRVAHSSQYNNQSILTGMGRRADELLSTALADSTETGVARVYISGTPTGVYTFEDNAGDGEITLGNGTVTQTIDLNQVLDQELNVVTGTTAVANFDRLGIQVTLAGQDATNRVSGSYVDGELNGKTIHLTGGTGGSFQVGPDNTVEDRLDANLPDMRASSAYLNLNVVSVSSQQSARAAVGHLSQAIDKAASVRADIGALMNRLDYTISFTANSIENNTNSEGTIRDADIAEEVSGFTNSKVTTQAATAMLAQANLTPNSVLTLLRSTN